ESTKRQQEENMKSKISICLLTALIAMALTLARTPNSTQSTTSARGSTPMMNPPLMDNGIALVPDEEVIAPSKLSKTQTHGLLQAYGRVPLTFELNQGQTNPQVKFLA